VLYGAFLGTEGPAYRLLRHYGTAVYFGFTCLSMLIAGDAIYRVARYWPALTRTRLDLALVALVAALLLLGLINVFVAPLFDAETKDRIENVAEWWGAAILSIVFLSLAWLWRRSNFRARFGVE
jgi:cytochrome bd-type quinol oxidase subunit 2